MKFLTTNGLEVEVDDADAEFVRNFTWHAGKQPHGTWYAFNSSSRNGEKPGQRLHRMLTRPGEHEKVDHKDGNGLNCRRDNLRPCTHRQNMGNRGKKKGKYPLKGVWPAHDGTWYATVQGKIVGRYATMEQAGLGYDRTAEKVFDFPRLNFPHRKDVPVCLGIRQKRKNIASKKWGIEAPPRVTVKNYVRRGRPRKFSNCPGQLSLL